jgi:hypothetical protein
MWVAKISQVVTEVIQGDVRVIADVGYHNDSSGTSVDTFALASVSHT